MARSQIGKEIVKAINIADKLISDINSGLKELRKTVNELKDSANQEDKE